MAGIPSNEELQSQLKEILQCSICLENFSDPRLLPCSHTYCLNCIKSAASNNRAQFQCPLRDGTTVPSRDIDALPLNRIVRDIIEVVSKYAELCNIKCCSCENRVAELWCRDCLNKGFCRECHENLHKLPALSDHRPGESRPPKIVPCSGHPNIQAEFWCKENQTPYCGTCLIQKQQQHKCELISDAVNEIIHQINDKFTKHPFSTDPKVELNEINTKYETESTLRKSNVAEIFASLRRIIDDREKLINENLSDIDVQNKKKIEEYQAELTKKWTRYREQSMLFNQRVTTGDYVTLLRDRENYDQIFTRANEERFGLKPPVLVEFNVGGLEQCQALMKQSLEKIRVVEQPAYENPQLEQLIAQQQNDSTLNLNNQGVNDFDTMIVAQALRTNMKITTLYLGNNQIRVTGAKRIADSLRYNKILTALDLWSNQIGTIGAQHLADVLLNNTTLTELGLNANQIDNKGAQHFADILRQNKTLITLHLADNEIGDAGAQSLVDMLANNTTLTTLTVLQNKEISANLRTQLETKDTRLH